MEEIGVKVADCNLHKELSSPFWGLLGGGLVPGGAEEEQMLVYPYVLTDLQ